MNAMPDLLFISSTPYSEYSGGGSGISHQCFSALQHHASVKYCHILIPATIKIEAWRSKFMKALHLPRNYFVYSDKRLTAIAEKVENAIKQNPAKKLFFAGFTPWVKVRTDIPYAVYNDICFATYVKIYNRGEIFSSRDLDRIFELEKSFLSNAEHVFFRSRWGSEMAKAAYGMDGKNFYAAGRGGITAIPDGDSYSGKKLLLFISREFIPKGGDIACGILKKLHEKHTDVELVVIGDPPPKKYLEQPGVRYVGFINKNIPEENSKLIDLLGQAMFLIHPTAKDTNPLVLSEAGYFGCPSVSMRAFAIPELVHDGEDGILMDSRHDIDAAVAKLEHYFADHEAYMRLRRNARQFHVSQNNWDVIAQNMLDKLSIDK